LTGLGRKQTAGLPQGETLGHVFRFVTLDIALPVWSLTESYLRECGGLLLTLNGSWKQLTTRLDDGDITT